DEGRHGGQVLAAGPQGAGAGRAAHLVAGEGVEVATDRCDVDRTVRCGLRAVHRGDDAAPAGFAADLAHRVDRAEHVGDVRQREDLHLRRQQRVKRIEVEFAGGVDFRDFDLRAGAFGHELPRHDVGVVLHAGENDRIAGTQVGQGPGVSDQVEGEGGATAQHQLVGADVEEC